MEQKIRCIYRKKKSFHICNKTALKNSFYCCYHIHSKKKHLCKIFHNILGDRHDITVQDIYNIYIYIVENTTESDDIFIYILFIDILKMIKVDRLSKIYKDYLNNHIVANATTVAKDICAKIYELNNNTHQFSKRCNQNTLIGFQEIVKYKVLTGSDTSTLFYLNNEDVFTTENICDIPRRRLFTIKDAKGVYGFDIVELEYFIRKCKTEGIAPYNPYTREAFSDNVIWRMNMKFKYSHLAKKTDDCRWTTQMNAYTDLSIEIERRGFYNNPEWFKKMPRHDLLKCIKLFRDFSCPIEESKRYFNFNEEDNEEAFVYAFCKEAIRLFRECNDDLYILCCNFMKSLAICSNDFYSNIPDWLSNYETPSFMSNISNLTNFNSLIATLINTRNTMNAEFNIGIGDDLLNNIEDVNANANAVLPNPSNNFLLYYYVEYM